MGDAYSRAVLGTVKPSVGLMSIGEEEAKGNDLTKEAFPLLRQLSNINFVGNVEGRDVFAGDVDVIVTDGFTGNVMLKLSEGLTEAVLAMLKRELTATAVTKAGAVLAKPAFRSIKKRLDYSEYGGAPLLGVRHIVVIGHAYKLAVSSTKSMTGHLLGAAGGIEGVFSVMAIDRKVLPPTINYFNPDPECDLDYVPNEPRPAEVNYVLSNSFGFGGTNAALLFKRYEE